jgi:hypothetical protein
MPGSLKLTTVMVELLRSGQPVKWDGLGVFQPGIESKKMGLTAEQMKAKQANPDQDVVGVHINFIPESSKGEDLSSRAFKDLCVFENVGVIEYVRKGGTGQDRQETGKAERLSFRSALRNYILHITKNAE